MLLKQTNERQGKIQIKIRSGCCLASIQEQTQGWKPLFEMLTCIRRQSSPAFHQRRAKDIEACECAVSSFVRQAVAAQAQQFWVSIHCALEYIEKSVKGEVGLDEDERVAASLKSATLQASMLGGR